MRQAVVVVCALGLMVLAAPPTLAHRCDGCFNTRSGPPGTVVVIWRAYRVEWNGPEVSPQGPSLGPYHPHRRTLTLLSRSEPRRNLRVRVPDVRPGVYSLIAYDGSEGGEHYMWTTFRVQPSSRKSLAPTGQLVALPVALGVTLLVLGCVLIRAGKKMERRRPFRRFGRARGEALRSQASTVARPTTPTSA